MNKWRGWSDTPRHRRSPPITIAKLEIPAPTLWDAYSIAMAQYLPAPLEVPVTYYAAKHEGRAWRLSSQLEVIQVPGGHDGCLTIGAELLVDHLRQKIDWLDSAPSAIEPHTSPPMCSHGAQIGDRLLGTVAALLNLVAVGAYRTLSRTHRNLDL